VAADTNGAVALLAEGHTVRFTAATNCTGLTGFTFNAADALTGLTLGTTGVGVLVTNVPHTPPTLAPVLDRAVIPGAAITLTNYTTDSP